MIRQIVTTILCVFIIAIIPTVLYLNPNHLQAWYDIFNCDTCIYPFLTNATHRRTRLYDYRQQWASAHPWTATANWTGSS